MSSTSSSSSPFGSGTVLPSPFRRPSSRRRSHRYRLRLAPSCRRLHRLRRLPFRRRRFHLVGLRLGLDVVLVARRAPFPVCSFNTRKFCCVLLTQRSPLCSFNTGESRLESLNSVSDCCQKRLVPGGSLKPCCDAVPPDPTLFRTDVLTRPIFFSVVPLPPPRW